MIQRAPRTAAFASTVATMSLIALLANAFLGKYPGQEGQRVLLKPLFDGILFGNETDYWASTGWSLQEWIWLVMTICLGMLAVWGRGERSIPELPRQRSVEEQIADFESTSTMVSSPSTALVSQHTSSILSSIVPEKPTIDEEKIQSATELLSSSDLGKYAASIVSERNTDIESRTMESELQPTESEEIHLENREFISDGPAYIPLPGVEKSNKTPPPIRDHKTEFVSDGPKNVPLPELPDLDDDDKFEPPEMPDLDDLFDSKDSTPTLPNLDDLF